jgi:hypothetical protein
VFGAAVDALSLEVSAAENAVVSAAPEVAAVSAVEAIVVV